MLLTINTSQIHFGLLGRGGGGIMSSTNKQNIFSDDWHLYFLHNIASEISDGAQVPSARSQHSSVGGVG